MHKLCNLKNIHFKKDTPHSELLFNIVLNQKTSASGHNIRCQKNESITTVNAINTIPVGIAVLKSLQ